MSQRGRFVGGAPCQRLGDEAGTAPCGCSSRVCPSGTSVDSFTPSRTSRRLIVRLRDLGPWCRTPGPLSLGPALRERPLHRGGTHVGRNFPEPHVACGKPRPRRSGDLRSLKSAGPRCPGDDVWGASREDSPARQGLSARERAGASWEEAPSSGASGSFQAQCFLF